MAAAQKEIRVVADGKELDLDTFTFDELDEYREYVRDLLGNPEAQPLGPEVLTIPPAYRWMAMYVVGKRRKDPKYTLEHAKALTIDEITKEVTVRPTSSTRKRAGKEEADETS